MAQVKADAIVKGRFIEGKNIETLRRDLRNHGATGIKILCKDLPRDGLETLQITLAFAEVRKCCVTEEKVAENRLSWVVGSNLKDHSIKGTYIIKG